ncbi:hypothetical protein BC332_22808 [Capsicum chinense]|nr:hypothetical protein BC332_22808 [Capsicum chinense]
MSLDENKREKFPWLVIHHGDNKQEQTFCNILENKSYVTSIPELRNKKICACCRDEWLVLRDFDSGDCYLWNPSSEDKIQLPPLPKYKYLKCLLSAPPRDPECLVLLLISQTALDDDDPDDENSDDNELFYVCESYCRYIMKEVDEFQVFRGTNLMKGFICHIEGRLLYVINVETVDLSVSLPCQHVSETKPWPYWLNVSSKTVDRCL